MIDFHGLPKTALENEFLSLEYLTTAGPRIVGLSYRSSANLFADAFHVNWETPNGKYSILGGHRLWSSPEIPEITYIPDDKGLRVQKLSARAVELSGKPETGSLLHKTMRIEMDETRPVVTLTHIILNENPYPLTLSPWSISMFKLGGTVILPQPVGNADQHGLLNNRLLALWPKTRIGDPRLTLRDDFILIHAESALPSLKIGYSNPDGWVAYYLDGIWFRINFDLRPGLPYPDGGCNCECYCDDSFLEMETLGPLETLAPGKATQMRETWELQEGLEGNLVPEELKKLLSVSSGENEP